jgi:hypothetical protein
VSDRKRHPVAPSVVIWLLVRPRMENEEGSAGKSPAVMPTAPWIASETVR